MTIADNQFWSACRVAETPTAISPRVGKRPFAQPIYPLTKDDMERLQLLPALKQHKEKAVWPDY